MGRAFETKRAAIRLNAKRRGAFKYLCTVHGFRGKVIVKK